MSDWYEAVAVRAVDAARATMLAQNVIEHLAREGIIESKLDSESVLGGDGGYRPGSRIADSYALGETESDFSELVTNGMEPCIGRWVNTLGFTCFDGFTCGECGEKFAPDDDLVADPFVKAIGDFMDGVDDPTVPCPKCNSLASVRKWKTNPHFGFVNLAFQFWNWPPLGSDSWKVSIPTLIQEATDHDLILTYGRL